MSFKTTNGTATTSDTDYVAKTGSITFAPGETAKTVTINVKGDSKRESSELFYFDLFGKSGNSSLRKNHGIGTILNDDLYREWEEGDRDPYAHQAHRSVPTPSRRTVCAPGTTTLLSYRRPHLVTSLLVTSLKNGAK